MKRVYWRKTRLKSCIRVDTLDGRGAVEIEKALLERVADTRALEKKRVINKDIDRRLGSGALLHLH